jgi:monofunctional biosynthetic peptidoglycan transglycosylase
MASLLCVAAGALMATRDLVRIWPLRRNNPEATALMLARGQNSRGAPQKVWVSYHQAPAHLRHAIVAAEDLFFFEHHGIDLRATRQAAQANVQAGRIVRGGSTITQQLAKNLFLSESRSLYRKSRDAALAVELELVLTKQRILELYINTIELGDGIYGCGAASRHYFKKELETVTPAEAVTLASIIPMGARCDPLARCTELIQARSKRITALLDHPVFLNPAAR